MRFPLRNLAWIVALAVAMTIAGGPGVLKAAPRGEGGMGMNPGGAGRMAGLQQHIQERLDSMCTFLGLNDEQKQEAQDLFDARREEMRDLFQKVRNNELSREEARDLMRQSAQEHRKQLEALLTPEQLDKLKQWDKEHPRGQGRMQGAPGGRRGGMGPGMGARRSGVMGPAGARGPLDGVLMGLRRQLNLNDQQVAQFRKLAGTTMNELFDKFSAVLDKDQQKKLQNIREHIKERREMRNDGKPGE